MGGACNVQPPLVGNYYFAHTTYMYKTLPEKTTSTATIKHCDNRKTCEEFVMTAHNFLYILPVRRMINIYKCVQAKRNFHELCYIISWLVYFDFSVCQRAQIRLQTHLLATAICLAMAAARR